jgi:hypothetical protein
MFVREFSGFFDVFTGENLAGEIRFHDVLQAGEFGVVEKAAARADVGIDEAGVGGILPPMRELVAVGVENRVEAKGLNDDLPKLASALNRKNLS